MRCEWPKTELEIKYHDEEWGNPLHDDQRLFEFLILEGMQAGLSWSTILNKRENFRKAFNNFDPQKVAKYTEKKVQQLLKNQGIVRNQLKIRAAIKNAKVFLAIQQEHGSFNKYIWGFVNNKPIVNNFKSIKDHPTSTQLSDAISKDLKKRGMSFVGSTIMYAFMQATGMVNDHTVNCYCHPSSRKIDSSRGH